MNAEHWARLKKPFDRYEVSDLGRVRNSAGYYFRCGSAACGYPRVRLSGQDSQECHKLVHVLVAEMFVAGRTAQKKTVHHIDGNRLNASAINLQWVTTKENCERKTCSGAGKRTRPVLKLDMRGNVLCRYLRLKDVPHNRSLIWRCCIGRIHMAYGFQWIYEDSQDLPGEVWRPVPKTQLQVSSSGRIKTSTGYKTFGHKTISGYMSVAGQMVHKLVCLAFHGNPIAKTMVVNHKDSNRSNNRPDNLEWVTQSQNRTVIRDWRANVWKRKVVKIADDGTETVYPSLQAASLAEKTSKGNICMTCRGLRKKCVGYRWEYRP